MLIRRVVEATTPAMLRECKPPLLYKKIASKQTKDKKQGEGEGKGEGGTQDHKKNNARYNDIQIQSTEKKTQMPQTVQEIFTSACTPGSQRSQFSLAHW